MPPTLKNQKWKKRILLSAATLIAIVIGLCGFLRISSPLDLLAYREMAGSFHPVWRQFAFRRFGAGDSAERLFQYYSPSTKEQFGRFGVYTYYPGDPQAGIWFTGLAVAVEDGKLLRAHAWSCSWRFIFFSTPNVDFDKAYAAFAKERREKELGL